MENQLLLSLRLFDHNFLGFVYQFGDLKKKSRV